MRPTIKLIFLICLIGILTFLGVLFPIFDFIRFILIIGLIIILIIEVIYITRFSEIEIERKHNDILSIGMVEKVTIVIKTIQDLTYYLTLCDTPPHQILLEKCEQRIKISGKNEYSFSYNVLARERGTFDFNEIFVKVETPLGLLFRVIKIKSNVSIRVFPDIKELSKYTLLLKSGTLEQVGIKMARMRGQGTDFESLREYQKDDSYKWIDWKATAKHTKLISKNFQPEKNQLIYLMIDAGRNLVNRIGILQKFDYLLNTASLLTYVASFYNDRIGVIIFSNKILKFIKAGKVKKRPYQIIEEIFDVRCEFCESNYEYAYSFLLSQVKRRSLIVTFTDLLDPYSSELAIKYNSHLTPKHLPLCVSISDSDLIEETERNINEVDDIFKKFTAYELLQDYKKTINILANRGVLVVNVPAKELSIQTINKYLKIKRSGLL
jgi:uncharacterized protein (DUF58 family)